MRQTPIELNIKRGTVVPPKEGWQEHTWYLVDIAYKANNPVQRSLFFSGFLTGKDRFPGGYNQLVSIHTPGGGDNVINDAFYVRVISKLFTAQELDNE